MRRSPRSEARTPAGRARRWELADHDFHEQVTVRLERGEEVRASRPPIAVSQPCTLRHDGAAWVLGADEGEVAADFAPPVPGQLLRLDPQASRPLLHPAVPLVWDATIELRPEVVVPGVEMLRLGGAGVVWLAVPGYRLAPHADGDVLVDPDRVAVLEEQMSVEAAPVGDVALLRVRGPSAGLVIFTSAPPAG